MWVFVFKGWIGVLGVTSFSILVWSIPTCFSKALCNFPYCGAPGSPRREFVWEVGSKAPKCLWTVRVCLWKLNRERTDCPFWQRGVLGCPLFTSGQAFGPSYLGFPWLSWKSKRASCLWVTLRMSTVPCYFLWQLLGKYLSSSQDTSPFPWEKVSEGRRRRDVQRCGARARAAAELCCSACSVGLAGLTGPRGSQDAMLLRGLQGKTPWQTTSWDKEAVGEKERPGGTFNSLHAEPYLLLASCTSLTVPSVCTQRRGELAWEQLQLQRGKSWWPGLGACGQERERLKGVFSADLSICQV